MGELLLVTKPDHPIAMPAAAFLDLVAPAILNVAPERASKILELTADTTLTISESDEFQCYVDAGTHITVSTRVIEILWAYSYGATLVYYRVFQGNAAAGQAVTLPTDVRDALSLASWAADAIMAAPPSAWPDWAPIPGQSTDCVYNVAKELTLCAIGFLLLHEFGHRKLRHASHPDDIDIERDADYYAADWVLEGVEPETIEFRKRSLGMAIAFLVLTARGIATGDHDGVSHPRHFDRLINTLERFAPPEHEVWAFHGALLSMHMSGIGVPPPRKWLERHHDLVQHYAEVLSRDPRDQANGGT